MGDERRTKQQLMNEVMKMRQQVSRMEALEFERKKTEKALRESERRYRILIEHIADIIFTADKDWNFTFISPRFEEITGHHVQDLIWHPFFEVLAPESAEILLDKFRRGVLDEMTSIPCEVTFIHKDGSRIPIELNVIPMLDEKGQLTDIILIAARDITERKQVEKELLKAQKLESIGVLAGGIAHDFNNVLTAILGNISLARMYMESSEAKAKILGRLSEAEEASIQAKSLTQKLLTFSKGGAPIKKMIPIATLLRDSASFALSGSNAKCEFSIPDGLWPVEVDEGQMNQAINNIIINADQAMPEGGIVRIYAENLIVKTGTGLPLKPGPYIAISIEDQGVGIPQEHLQKIFDPYFTTKERRSGLGLATAYSIIKRHGGYITAESQIGVGTTLCIYLPASPEEELVKEDEMEKKAEEELAVGKGRIMVMDDEKSIRDIVSEMLRKLGYEADSAADGTEAIELYKAAMESGEPYDVVIIDLTVPGGMGGQEAIQRLREIDPEVKAIVSSGYSGDPVMANYKVYGFKGVMAKPYDIQKLSEVLEQLMMEN